MVIKEPIARMSLTVRRAMTSSGCRETERERERRGQGQSRGTHASEVRFTHRLGSVSPAPPHPAS